MSDWRKGLGVKVTYRIGPFGPEALITAPGGFACCVGVDYMPTLEEAALAAKYTLRYALLPPEQGLAGVKGRYNRMPRQGDQSGWLDVCDYTIPASWLSGTAVYGR